MLRVQNLKKSFQNTVAINIPDLFIDNGEIVGFVGNNGAGKTTFLRLVLDLLKPSNGNVLIDGTDVSSSNIWKKTTGSYIDTGFLIEYLTSEEFFELIASIYKIPNETKELRLHSFERFMDNEILGQQKYIRSFSAGNKQKVGIIAAMLMNPDLLILDEPFNFLDPSSQIVIKRLLKTLNAECGTTIIISSHNLEHITDVSSRIVLLEKGSIIKDIPNANLEAHLELVNYFTR
jgi:ABC-2 type transport system ATP-binding protein